VERPTMICAMSVSFGPRSGEHLTGRWESI
jgi:hypothetical protein